jgi:hypothetical protein
MNSLKIFLAVFMAMSIVMVAGRKPLAAGLVKLFEINRRFNHWERIEPRLRARGYSPEWISRFNNSRNPTSEDLQRFLLLTGMINSIGSLVAFALIEFL